MMSEGVLFELQKLWQADSTLGLVNRAGQNDDICAGCDGVDNLHIEFCLLCPAGHILISGACYAERRNDFDSDRRQTKLLIEYIHVLLQGGTSIGDDIHDCLPLACKTSFYEGLYAVGHAEIIGRTACARSYYAWTSSNRGTCRRLRCNDCWTMCRRRSRIILRRSAGRE